MKKIAVTKLSVVLSSGTAVGLLGHTYAVIQMYYTITLVVSIMLYN